MILDTNHKLMSLFEEYKDSIECILYVTKEGNDIWLSQSTLGSQDQIEICRSVPTTIREVWADDQRENLR